MSCFCLSATLSLAGICFTVAGTVVIYFQASQDSQLADFWLLLVILLGIGSGLTLFGTICGTLTYCCNKSRNDNNKVESSATKRAWSSDDP
uniref:Uncharacterized protein n=1 Tax=Tetranychus urticae TaxID=32264 RepID=T1KZL1_TETUR